MLNVVSNFNFLNLSQAQNLKLLRLSVNLSQTEMAKNLECSQGSISRLENGDLALTVFQLERIRQFFGISADDFLDSRIDFKNIAYRFENKNFSISMYLEKIEIQVAA